MPRLILQALSTTLLMSMLAPLIGCERPATDQQPPRADQPWPVVAPDALSPLQQRQRDAALAARDEMFGRLQAELAGAIETGGPASAIDVCAQRAPEIARDIMTKHNLMIGRTSWKLRSPQNRRPEWAALAVAGRTAEPVMLAGPDGRLGVLTPIILMNNCIQCHGSPDELAPGVADRLARLYPDDRATGFAVGDLRGWFWMEVPPLDQAPGDPG